MRVTAAVKLYVNATHYAQYPALNAVYEKSQSVMGGKLSFSYSIGPYLN